ncbi:MAG: reactive intermediate/imine deaminase [Candidatus Rokubacteria bacterium]|nr:reactive intermediate/imine deaminase [Candidatus Rokubacteria bacterium]
MAKREIISTDAGPRTGLPYSQAVRCGDFVFVAGQVAIDPATGQVVEGGVKAQTRRVLDNVQAILGAAGTSLEHAVETTCFLRDVADFPAFNEAYRGYFPKDPPARTTVQAGLPREGLLVEIRVVAAVPDGGRR